MCGFVGYFAFNEPVAAIDLSVISQMTDRLEKRGPDASGYWQDADVPLVLGHRRLAIVDLSAAGKQPMRSSAGRYVISYNGEIYNAPEIAKELATVNVYCKGYSDTEVLLEACAHWGVEQTLQKINGMFAFALWDTQEKKLVLARDRMGIKPLYWGFNNGVLFFGSQVNAFAAHPKWQPVLNRAALVPYFRFNYIPAPHTIYTDIFKLEPGTFVSVDANCAVQTHTYWSLDSHINKTEAPSDITQEVIESLLMDSVKRRMVSDVPLGAFLSGGIDSSVVVALMQAQSIQPIKTFSIGFQDAKFNEATHAKAVANHLKTDHHELYLSMNQARDIVPDMQSWYGEPFADSSQIPTYLVSKLAKEHVTVSLSGDGGDELFAGYNRYWTAQKIMTPMSYTPRFLREGVGAALTAIPESVWDRLSFIPKLPKQLGHKLHKLARLFKGQPLDFYKVLVSHWDNPESIVLNQKNYYEWPDFDAVLNDVTRMQCIDALTYLPNDILTKVDRASMACSLEARVPLLDHRLVEAAFSMPLSSKIANGHTKWPLREVLYRHVPKALIERPKMGFGVPVGDWLRDGLRDWAEDLLDPFKMDQEGLLNTQKIQDCWQAHLSGRANNQTALWGVLMFQDWKRHVEGVL